MGVITAEPPYHSQVPHTPHLLPPVSPTLFGVVLPFLDDLFVLTPTLFALNKIVNIHHMCELYVDQFNIKFNGGKGKVIVFDMNRVEHMPEVYVEWELSPHVK